MHVADRPGVCAGRGVEAERAGHLPAALAEMVNCEPGRARAVIGGQATFDIAVLTLRDPEAHDVEAVACGLAGRR